LQQRQFARQPRRGQPSGYSATSRGHALCWHAQTPTPAPYPLSGTDAPANPSNIAACLYTVAAGFAGFRSPLPRATYSKSTSSIPVLSDEIALEAPGGPVVPTGLVDLDEHVGGGMYPTTVWAVTGPSGVGRSMLVTQLARTAPLGVAVTRLVNGRERVAFTVAYLLAGHHRVPLHRLRTGTLHEGDAPRLAEGCAALIAAVGSRADEYGAEP
jgi:hypothetical protein